MGTNASTPYPVRLSVDYPDRQLDRLSTLLRIIWIIPIGVIIALVSGSTVTVGGATTFIAAGGLLFLAPLLMILIRQKYPRWWFEWNRELFRFTTRVSAYLAVMDDHYPSTDEEQSVHLDIDYPDVPRDLNRFLPLVKWFLAIPHIVVLVFVGIGAIFAVIVAWFSILFTGRYPRWAFDFVEGFLRWGSRVSGYAFLLITDRYPPFSLRP
ncbi:MAG: DUF4389 domain-containing protein [Thermoleophilia bacterium]|nr:DUF4389 domain-containing protein [Thermoleophilia bacterium]